MMGIAEERYEHVCCVDRASELVIYLSDSLIYIKINVVPILNSSQ